MHNFLDGVSSWLSTHQTQWASAICSHRQALFAPLYNSCERAKRENEHIFFVPDGVPDGLPDGVPADQADDQVVLVASQRIR